MLKEEFAVNVERSIEGMRQQGVAEWIEGVGRISRQLVYVD
jgi:hypothetical protein